MDEAMIINLTSASAYAFTAPGTSAYAGSKLAAMRIAECMACEHAVADVRGARIVNLHPGAVKTEMWEKSGGESVGIPCNDGESLAFSFVLPKLRVGAAFLAAVERVSEARRELAQGKMCTKMSSAVCFKERLDVRRENGRLLTFITARQNP